MAEAGQEHHCRQSRQRLDAALFARWPLHRLPRPAASGIRERPLPLDALRPQDRREEEPDRELRSMGGILRLGAGFDDDFFHRGERGRAWIYKVRCCTSASRRAWCGFDERGTTTPAWHGADRHRLSCFTRKSIRRAQQMGSSHTNGDVDTGKDKRLVAMRVALVTHHGTTLFSASRHVPARILLVHRSRTTTKSRASWSSRRTSTPARSIP